MLKFDCIDMFQHIMIFNYVLQTTGNESTQPLSPEPTEADKSKKESTEEKKTEGIFNISGHYSLSFLLSGGVVEWLKHQTSNLGIASHKFSNLVRDKHLFP